MRTGAIICMILSAGLGVWGFRSKGAQGDLLTTIAAILAWLALACLVLEPLWR